jgi:hypothetical protein
MLFFKVLFSCVGPEMLLDNITSGNALAEVLAGLEALTQIQEEYSEEDDDVIARYLALQYEAEYYRDHITEHTSHQQLLCIQKQLDTSRAIVQAKLRTYGLHD